MHLKEQLSSFLKDYLRIVIAVTNTILAISMIISPEPHDFFFWFTLVFRVSTVPVSIFVGNKGLWILYFIFCNVKALDITYNNYTCVALISLLFAMLPKVTKTKGILIALCYITDVFIVAGMHGKSGFYIYTHFMLCAQFCTAMWKQKVINKKESVKYLILTPDEIKILEQLDGDKPKKQVDGFSESTVYRKLIDARERNNFKDNDELVTVFNQQNKQNQS